MATFVIWFKHRKKYLYVWCVLNYFDTNSQIQLANIIWDICENVQFSIDYSNWSDWQSGCDFCKSHLRLNSTDVCKVFCGKEMSFKVSSRDCLADGKFDYISSNGTKVEVKPIHCNSYNDGILKVIGTFIVNNPCVTLRMLSGKI